MGENQHGVDYRFCPVCGGGLDTLRPKRQEPERLVCGGCGFVFYLDPKVVACTLLEMDGKVLLLKRAIDPQKGKWVIPGGYVDRGEDVATAAMRETEEECGLRCHIKGLIGVYSYPGTVAVVVVYGAEQVGGDLAPGDESLEALWFPLDQIPWKDLAFKSTVDALRDYSEMKRGVEPHVNQRRRNHRR